LIIFRSGHRLLRRATPALGALTGILLASALVAVPAGGAPGTAARTVAVKPTADAFVTSVAPRSNFGRARMLIVDRRPAVRSYLRFRVRPLGGPVRQATLRLYVTRARGRRVRVARVRARPWTERTITFGRAPRLASPIVRASVPVSGWVDLDVSRLVRRAGTIELALAYGTPAGEVRFASRESGTRAPRLVISSGTSADPVVAAAGNIACDPAWPEFNAGNGTATDCHQRDTSDLLVKTKLAAVLALGDSQYDCGGLAAYQQAYGPSWGRVKSITHPVPGNHDYVSSGGTDCDPTGNGGGYFAYFGSAARPAGTSYYSFNVGTWHVVALDSQCSAVGGCAPGSPEEAWLRADLAANPTKCTLAYWHYPLFSSGLEGARPEGARSEGATFWADLDRAGAEVVLNAHEHDYERFAPQHGNGQGDPKGIREFVVGTGGRMRHAFTTVAPNSQVRENGSWGVLELTLHTGSYSWRFVPVAGGTFSDSGSTACH